MTRTLHTERGRDGQVTGRTRRTVLPSGLRIVTEEMAGVRSASIGVWVGAGSRDESPTLHGCSHFLEHLLFKGTRERSALDISVAMDAVGGEFNAFTAKEYTSSTRASSRTTCRWPSTCSATWSPARCCCPTTSRPSVR